MDVAISHFGICCSDIDASTRFYTEALGFVFDRSLQDICEPFDAMTELPGKAFSAHFLMCGDFTLELLGFTDSEVVGRKERRPMNQLGITHMTLVVDDVDALSERIEKFGGKIVTDSRIQTPFGLMVFCTDPDGVRIELMEKQV